MPCVCLLRPSFAKRLRTVAEAGPVIAALVTGSEDKESTLSELYGGTGNEGSAVSECAYIWMQPTL